MRDAEQTRKRSKRRTKRSWRTFTVLLILGVASAITLRSLENRAPRERNPLARTPLLSQSQIAPAARNASLSVSQVAERPLFPYSVIPGGVESAQELKNAINRDPIVASHYADFDLSKARVVRLDRDRIEYVSYRLGNRIYWTNRQLKLHKGESVITDGTHEARTRCGNRLSQTEQAPESPKQPRIESMDATQNDGGPAVELPDAPLFAEVLPNTDEKTPGPGTPRTPGPTPPGGYVPLMFFPPVGGGGGTPGSPSGPPSPPLTPPGPPLSIPEPDTVELLVAGLSALCLYTSTTRRGKN